MSWVTDRAECHPITVFLQLWEQMTEDVKKFRIVYHLSCGGCPGRGIRWGMGRAFPRCGRPVAGL